MVRAGLLAGLLLLIPGCAVLPEEYDLGDGTRYILDLQNSYCNEGNLLAKYSLLIALQTVVPNYPEDGVCTDIPGVVLDYFESQASLNQ